MSSPRTLVSGSLVGCGVSSTIIYMSLPGAPLFLYAIGCVAAIAGTVLGIVWEIRASERRQAARGELR